MAYTTTTDSGSSTIIGTSKDDVLKNTDATTKTINVSSYEGDDQITISKGATGGNIGMGDDSDTVTVAKKMSKVNVTLGADKDTYTETAASDLITVGGQSGDDTITINESSRSIYGGGKGEDTFETTTSSGIYTTIRGGSEDDTFGKAGDFILGDYGFLNGQVGKDTINVDADSSAVGLKIYGGSEDDTITVGNARVTKALLSGDKGADTIVDAGGANTIDGGGGADKITSGGEADYISGGEGKDVFTQLAGSTAAAANSGTASSVGTSVAGDWVQNEVLVADFDIVTDFKAGTDTINLKGAAGATLLTASADDVATSTSYGIVGTYLNGAFTANEKGSDTLVFTSSSSALVAANTVANLGTNLTVLSGVTLTAAELTAAVVA